MNSARDSFLEMFTSQFVVEHTSAEPHACPNCGEATRAWTKPDWALGRYGEREIPDEYAADAPSELCCPECWAGVIADIQQAISEEDFQEDPEENALVEARRERKRTERAARPIGETVWVRRQWNDSYQGTVRREDLSGLHWSGISGGVQARAIQAFLHGYVLCSDFIEGGVSHSCGHGPPPHRIKVCITKKGNEAIFPVLEAAAEERTR